MEVGCFCFVMVVFFFLGLVTLFHLIFTKIDLVIVMENNILNMLPKYPVSISWVLVLVLNTYTRVSLCFCISSRQWNGFVWGLGVENEGHTRTFMCKNKVFILSTF